MNLCVGVGFAERIEFRREAMKVKNMDVVAGDEKSDISKRSFPLITAFVDRFLTRL